jgi:hypothetical protein
MAMADGEYPIGALGYGRLIGELTRLQVRYPKLIHHLSRDHQSIYIWYFIEDLAIECVRVLRAAGVHAEHHEDEARAVQLLTAGSIPEANQHMLLQTLDRFLERCTSGAL